jgi:hypothetical protein
MQTPDAKGTPATPGPVPRLAWVVAAVADLVQLVAFPFFGEGLFSPLNDVLDVLVSIVLLRLLGWHFVLLPALAAELVPVADLAPTWTLSVTVIALGRRGRTGAAAEAPKPAGPTGSRAEVVEESPRALPGPEDPPVG